MKKTKKFDYKFEDHLLDLKINKVPSEGYVSVFVKIQKRPHRLYERKKFNTDFIKNYLVNKYGYEITGTKKGGMLINYTSDPKKLMRTYEFYVNFGAVGKQEEPKVEISSNDVIYEAVDKGGNFGDYVKDYRKENKISQKKLSEMTGIAVGRISGIENNKIKPTKEEIKAIFVSEEDIDERIQ